MKRTQKRCPECRRSSNMNMRYDAVCCLYCDEWLEPVCDDPKHII